MGHLLLKIISADILEDVYESFGEIHPFVIVRYQFDKYKTTVYDEGPHVDHYNPVWDKVFKIDIYSHDDAIQIDIHDRDAVGTNLVGRHNTTVTELIKNTGMRR